MRYKHLTKEQRYTIDALLQTPMSLREIGEVIGVSTGTVSREIRRNCDMRGYHRYRWRLAQKKYERRMKGEEMVCAETIYRWIWQEKRRGNDEMARNLRHRGRRKRRRDSLYSSRGIIQDRVDISLRPSVVEEKKRFGDFEIDTMIGRNRKGAIMTTNDRCTHLVVIRRLAGKEAAPPASTAIEALLPYKDKIHTITADNGKEFARHKEIAKGLDAEFEWKLNHRPRKSLGYRTPLE